MTRTPAQRSGDAAESLVGDRLVAAGWRVLGRQVRVGRDELDLVAVDPGPPGRLVAVEVRMRARRDFGLAEETFDYAKRRRIRRAMFGLVGLGAVPDGTRLPRLPVAIDLVVVEPGNGPDDPPRIRHHRDVG